VITLAVALVVAAPAYTQTGREGPGGPVDLVRPEVRDLGPRVGGDREPPVILSAEMQLVGFTTRIFAGNAGVLNMSLGCRNEFLGSRMCTLQEVNMSVLIPRAPVGEGNAWIQNLGVRDGSLPDNNCNGWTATPSALSMRVDGTTLAWQGECYGGVVLMNCSLKLPIACCSKHVPFP